MKIRKYFVGLIAMLGMLAMGFYNTGVLTTLFAADSAVVDTEAELKEALANGGEVTLESDIKVDETILIPTGVTSTLDLNGYAITSGYQSDSTTKHIYPFNNYGKLTIQDSKGEGSIRAR